MDAQPPPSLPLPDDGQRDNHLLVDRYEVFEIVGSGPMGKVFRAWDQEMQRMVAIKVLDEHLAAEARVAETFEAESLRAAGLPDHPNVVTVFEVVRNGNIPCVVMQFVTAGSLRDLLQSQETLPLDEAFRIGRQIALGLEFAREYGLVHGDLKPENVLVPHNGHARVADFGLAQALQMSQTTQLLPGPATNSYMAPERYYGSPPDALSDIYSLGALIYEMLAGTPPSGMSRSWRTADIQPAASLQERNPAVTAQAEALVMRALRPSPADRYTTPGMMGAALHEYLLQEKGETPAYFYMPDPALQTPPEPAKALPTPIPSTPTSVVTQTEPAPQPVNGHTASAQPVQKPSGRGPSRAIGFTSLVWLLVLGLALAGGWYSYKAVNRLINGGTTTSHKPAAVRHDVKPGIRIHAHRVVPPRHVSACGVQPPGTVQLLRIWVEATTQPAVGQPLTLDYTLANNATTCARVALGFSATSPTRAGNPITDPAHAAVIDLHPGTHLVKRQFTFPPSAAGHVYDVEFSVTDPSQATVYGTNRVPRLLTVH